MKNFIFLNYSIVVKKIYFKNNQKFFFSNNEKILIIENNYDEKYIYELFRLSNELFFDGIKVNTFIINNFGRCFSTKNDNKIILLKTNDFNDFSFEKIILFKGRKTNLDNYNILEEWKKEVDLFESEMAEYNKEHSIIKESLDFFIGCAENAIELLNNYKRFIQNNNDSIGHRIDYNTFKISLDDPFSFIKTNKMFDMANYFKSQLIINKLDYDKIDYVINNNNEYENAFLFANLLFPNLYFSIAKNNILFYKNEEILHNLLNCKNRYINLLSYCMEKIKNVKDIKFINWINK